MTLIIAKIEGDNIHIESDSKITDPKKVKQDPLCGILKSVIIDPRVCISFAGNTEFAQQALGKINKTRYCDTYSLCQMLLNIHRESIPHYPEHVDFAVASIINGIPRLFKIADEMIIQGLDYIALGNPDGIKLYEEKYDQSDHELPIQQRIQNAFSSVIHSPRITTIGDFQISVNIDSKICPNFPVFMYNMKFFLEIGPQTVHCQGGKETAIPLGTAVNGSNGVSYLVSVCPEFYGVAIHFMHGNFGVLFCHKLNFHGIVISEVTGKEFMDRIREEYNIPLRGLVRFSDTSIQFCSDLGHN